MVPSKKNLSAAVLLIIIVIVAAVCPLCSMAAPCPQDTPCRHLSGNYGGPCWGFDNSCGEVCVAESPDNITGECDCEFRCWCYTCNDAADAVAAVASAPAEAVAVASAPNEAVASASAPMQP